MIIYFESSKLRKKKGILINVIYVRAQEQDKFLEDEILRASGMQQDEIDTLDNDE